MKNFLFSATFVLCLAFLSAAHPPKAQALTTRFGEDVLIPEDERVEDSLLVAGKSVVVKGEVFGDVYCAGQSVQVDGAVHGDVICAGQSVMVNGTVDGSVRAAGQNIRVNGAVSRNVTVAGQDISTDGNISGELLAGAQSLSVNGPVKGDVVFGAESAHINSRIGRDVRAEVDTLSLNDSARVDGNLRYRSSRQAQFAPTATVSGETVYSAMATSKRFNIPGKAVLEGFDAAKKVVGFLTYLAVGALLMFFAKEKVVQATDLMVRNPKKMFGKGLLVVVLMVVAAVFLTVTIVGIPLAVLLLLLYVFAAFFAKLFFGIMLGRKIAQDYFVKRKLSLMASGLLGITLFALLTFVPVFGFFLSLTATLWGLGGIYFLVRPEKNVARRK